MLNRAGKSKIGCVIWLVVLVVVGYTAKEFGSIYLRRLKLEDTMQQQAGFAGQASDDAIRQRILQQVMSMGLPPEARRIMMTRAERPRAIRIQIRYTETVDFFFTTANVPVSIEVRRAF